MFVMVAPVMESTATGRQLKARYAFAGGATELDRTLPLAADENVLFHGVMRMHRPGRLPRPALLRLTPPRLVILAHRAFGSDRVWELPRGAVRDIELIGTCIEISYIGQGGTRSMMQLKRWSGATRMDRAVREATQAAGTLRGWLASADGLPGTANAPHGHRQF